MCVSACGGLRLTLSVFLDHSLPYILKWGLCFDPNLTSLATWVAPEMWSLPPPSWAYRWFTRPTQVLHGCLDLNSGPHTALSALDLPNHLPSPKLPTFKSGATELCPHYFATRHGGCSLAKVSRISLYICSVFGLPKAPSVMVAALLCLIKELIPGRWENMPDTRLISTDGHHQASWVLQTHGLMLEYVIRLWVPPPDTEFFRSS